VKNALQYQHLDHEYAFHMEILEKVLNRSDRTCNLSDKRDVGRRTRVRTHPTAAPLKEIRLNPTTAIVAAALACSIAPAALAQFSSDPTTQLQVGDNAGNAPKVRINPLGGYYVAWQGGQFDGGNTLVQRLDENGNPQWTAGGVQVTDAQYTGSFEDYGFTVDALGNAIVAYRDNHTGSLQIALQKVAPDGTTPWGANGVTIVHPAGFADSPHSPRVVVTSDGNYVVAYSRGTTTSTATSRAFYQKVNSSTGALMWNSGESVMIAPTANGYTAADMVLSDNGNVIATFFTAGSFSVSRRIHAQKLDGATGAQLWNGGVPKVVQTASTLQIGNFPTVISDQGNGVVIGWYETASPFQCKFQHLDAAGTELVASGGVGSPVIAGEQRTSPHIAFDPATGSTYMSYVQSSAPTESLRGVSVQMFDSSGTAQWGNGVTITPLVTAPPTPSFTRVTLTSGGVIVSWFEGLDASGTLQMIVRSAMVSEEGSLEWPSILEVNTLQNPKSRLDAVSLPGGATVLAYGHNPGTLNIIASRVNSDGTLGNPAPTCGSADFDGDGDTGTDADIEAFFACLGGSCCPTCGSADFDFDGDTGTDADIEAFFRVLGGGTC
jgi:hypothetical protein